MGGRLLGRAARSTTVGGGDSARRDTFQTTNPRGTRNNGVDGTPYELTTSEVDALPAYVAELAEPREAEAAERLLGQLAGLAQHRDSGVRHFTPVPAASALAARAVEALRGEGHVRIGGRRWRIQRSSPSSASNSRL